MKKSAKKSEKPSTDGQSVTTTYSTLTSQEQNALEVFAKHEHIWVLYEATGEIVNFHPHIRQELVDAYKVFQPHYHYNQGCSVCIAEMLRDIYRFYYIKK